MIRTLRAERHVAAQPLPRTLPPLERLLILGGDGRLALDGAIGLNVYGCRPAPRPEALNFSSSTASSISEGAWRQASLARERLVRGESRDAIAHEQRAMLARLLGVSGLGDVVFAPSGTDAALIALAGVRATTEGALTSVLAACDETGSGMACAASGRHFAATTALGRAVERGSAVAGLEGVAASAVALRDPAGALRDPADCDRAIEAAVADGVAAGRRVVLYAMDHSKLGNRSPSEATLQALEIAFGDDVRIIIDACQLRIGRAALRRHIERGRMVLVTGSKFFGGPPLSGALIVPPSMAEALAHAKRLPHGLGDYSVASDWPAACRFIRAALPERNNIGETLRWTAALAEMEAWFSAGLVRRRAMLGEFAASVARAAACCPSIELLPPPASDDAEFPAPSILPFFVTHGGETVSPSITAKLHRALNRDLRGLLPGLDARGRSLAAAPCHIGQPVAVGPRGAVLRVAAGARLLAEDANAVGDGLAQVFAKIELLLKERPLIDAAF
jgi:hypothetical protein